MAGTGSPGSLDTSALLPRISVAIPTRNRPQDLQRCLESLAAVEYPSWDIIVVDQSDNGETKQLTERFAPQLPGLRYHRLSEKGASRARNCALQLCTADALAFLDDDCTVSSDWLSSVGRTFVRYPESLIVLGAVRAAPHDPQSAFVPTSTITTEQVFQGRWSFLNLRRAGREARIMSACMSMRPQIIESAGFFDVRLGPGSQFGTAEDLEYTYRALRGGVTVVMTPSVEVVHYGARTYQDGVASRTFRTDGYALGGVDMKLLRCGEWLALIMIFVHAIFFLRQIQPGNVLRLRQPTGLAWIIWYARGLLASFAVPVDRRRLLYLTEVDRKALA